MLGTKARDWTAGYVHSVYWYIGYNDNFSKIKDPHYNRYVPYLAWAHTVILQIFGVVLISVFSVVNGFTEIK